MYKKLSKSLIIVAAIFVMGGYEAYACFVQGKEPIWDTFGKKNLDLEIDYAGYYDKAVDGHPNAGFWKQQDLTTQKFFDVGDIKPGDSGEGTISLHLKGQDAWGCAIIRPTENDDKSSTGPELLVDQKDNPSDKWDGELAQNMDLRVWADICSIKNKVKPGDNIYQPGCDKLLQSGKSPLNPVKLALADSADQNVFSGNSGPLKKDQDYFLGADWSVPSSVGNIIQTDSYKADVTFYVQQSDSNGKFLCKDIDDSDPDKCQTGATRSCFSGDAGMSGIGICQIGIQTCAKGDWGKCSGEILPVKEICADKLDNDCNGRIDEGCPTPCQRVSDCDDHNSKTDDQCSNRKCGHTEKKDQPHR